MTTDIASNRQIASLQPMALPHVLDARQFTPDWLEQVLFPAAQRLQQTSVSQLPNLLAGKRLFYLFYEPSTRTRISFETAMMLLGGSAVGMDSHQHHPGDESLEDRIRVLNAYLYDFILLRYHAEGGAQRAAAVSQVPIINAGDGSGQHPTQALLDAYTVWRERGRLDGLRVALVGDLSYERTTNSLAYLLGQFPGQTFYLVSPSLLRMRDDVREYLIASGAAVEQVRDLRAIASAVDVVYMTKANSPRLEHAQRFPDGAGTYAIDATVLAQLPAQAMVLHPLPRGQELPPAFDGDPRIACFRQAQNGLFVRMALLSLLVGVRP